MEREQVAVGKVGDICRRWSSFRGLVRIAAPNGPGRLDQTGPEGVSRVFPLDQRGTGYPRQSPGNAAGDGQCRGPSRVSCSLSRRQHHYRDAEVIRQQLGAGVRGRCWDKASAASDAMHHLSAAPDALREVLITGGIPPLIDLLTTSIVPPTHASSARTVSTINAIPMTCSE